ncbi:MAG: hypothetical protein LBI82_05225 [Dysgonamonadaceae bacterium]|nr:hypothetical protein [Dysgonamonadaceae bacterium]
MSIVIFNSCSKDDVENSPFYDKGVIINGVKWATRNVAAPGRFVASSEDYGEYYQWNKGTTDFLLTKDYYNSVYANSASWLSINDPSPIGWHIPTLEEIETLLYSENVTNEWTIVNKVTGRKFTDKTTGNSLFLPAAGCCSYSDGLPYDFGSCGMYWNNAQRENTNPYELGFNSRRSWYAPTFNVFGLSIRPVAD